MVSFQARSIYPLVLMLVAAGGCATTQPVAPPVAANGITVVVPDNASCKTSGTVENALPNDDLCREIVSTLRSDLIQQGFTVAHEGGPGALNLAVGAVQSASQSVGAADLTIEVRLKRATDELEVFSEAGEVTRDPSHGQLSSVVHALATDVSGSKRLVATGAAGKGSSGAAAGL